MKLYSVSRTADLLGIHKDTLRDWEAAGQIKASYTAGGHRRFSSDEIDKLRLNLTDEQLAERKNFANTATKVRIDFGDKQFVEFVSMVDTDALAFTNCSFGLADNYGTVIAKVRRWLAQWEKNRDTKEQDA